MAVTKRLRFEVLRRDNFACRYCGAKAPDAELTVDHVTPRALGGPDAADNLVACCRDCNGGKASAAPDSTHVAQVADDALRWAAAIKQAAAAMEANTEAEVQFLSWFDETWASWHYGEMQREIPRPAAWRHTVKSLATAGLTPPLLEDCVRIAMQSHVDPQGTWAYFCGVGWRTVDALQERARTLLEGEAQA